MDRTETVKEDYQKIYTHEQVREFDKSWASDVLYFKKVYEKRIRKLKNNKKKLKKILAERNDEIAVLHELMEHCGTIVIKALSLASSLKSTREYE